MPRLPRQLQDHGCYHLIARGNNRQFLFTAEESFRYFLDLLARGKPKFMQFVLQGYARWFCMPHHYSGHVWQGRYKSPLVERESYSLEAGRYIERNPLRARLVTDLKDYRWSSYPTYAYGRTHALVDEDPYYAQLGPTPTDRQAAYRDFVRLESPYAPMLDQTLVEAPF